MNIKKYSGNFEVIDSGTLLAYSGYSDIETSRRNFSIRLGVVMPKITISKYIVCI